MPLLSISGTGWVAAHPTCTYMLVGTPMETTLSAGRLGSSALIFDEGSISVIASDTVREIGRLAGRSLDVRRFRSNVSRIDQDVALWIERWRFLEHEAS